MRQLWMRYCVWVRRHAPRWVLRWAYRLRLSNVRPLSRLSTRADKASIWGFRWTILALFLALLAFRASWQQTDELRKLTFRSDSLMKQVGTVLSAVRRAQDSINVVNTALNDRAINPRKPITPKVPDLITLIPHNKSLPKSRASLRALAIKPDATIDTIQLTIDDEQISIPAPQLTGQINDMLNYRDSGNYSQCVACANAILQTTQKFAGIYANLAYCLYNNGKYAEAKMAWVEAIRRDSAYTNARLNLGIALLNEGKAASARSAIDVLLPIIRQDTRSAECYYQLYRAYRLLGENEKALNYYSMAKQLNPYYIKKSTDVFTPEP